jgi:hypothetical protein
MLKSRRFSNPQDYLLLWFLVFCAGQKMSQGDLGLVPVDPVTIVVGGIIRSFVMPSKRRHFAKGRFVDTKGTDGTKRVFIRDVVSIHAVDIGGSVAFV